MPTWKRTSRHLGCGLQGTCSLGCGHLVTHMSLGMCAAGCMCATGHARMVHGVRTRRASMRSYERARASLCMCTFLCLHVWARASHCPWSGGRAWPRECKAQGPSGPRSVQHSLVLGAWCWAHATHGACSILGACVILGSHNTWYAQGSMVQSHALLGVPGAPSKGHRSMALSG